MRPLHESQPDPNELVRFFRPTGRGIAVRYGVGVMGGVYDGKGRLSFIDTDAVIGITRAEATRFRREYARQLREGAIVEVTREEFEARLRGGKKD